MNLGKSESKSNSLKLLTNSKSNEEGCDSPII